jgi:hypothetical protein
VKLDDVTMSINKVMSDITKKSSKTKKGHGMGASKLYLALHGRRESFLVDDQRHEKHQSMDIVGRKGKCSHAP